MKDMKTTTTTTSMATQTQTTTTAILSKTKLMAKTTPGNVAFNIYKKIS